MVNTFKELPFNGTIRNVMTCCLWVWYRVNSAHLFTKTNSTTYQDKSILCTC